MSTDNRRRWHLSSSMTPLIMGVGGVLLALGVIAQWRPPINRLWGDEGTFVAMTASLVRDGDLKFEEPDQQWALSRQPGPPVTVILQQTEQGIAYSKPILYPLLAAPLFALLGEAGLVATNLLALLAAIGITWKWLRAMWPLSTALWQLGTFACCSVLPPYVTWMMSDLVLAAMCISGLVLAIGGLRLAPEAKIFGSAQAQAVGGLLLGLQVSMRFTAAAIAGAAVLALLTCRRPRRALLVGGMALAAFLVTSFATWALIGTANPYKAARSSFDAAIGYPAGSDSGKALSRFTTNPATQSASWQPALDIGRTAYSTFYFLVGRHTGLLPYFPAALVLLLAFIRQPDRIGVAMILGVFAICGFYLLWMPENYFGGSTFIGNRYFLGVFPALLLAIRKPLTPRLLAIAWALGLLSWGSAAFSVASTHELDHSSQSHTRAGLFRLLPFESTAHKIDGVEDRFWAQDHIRFVDRSARPGRWSFRLDSRRGPAEIVVATQWPGQALLFLVSPEVPEVELEVKDWRRSELFRLPRTENPAPGLIEVAPATAWRRHRFWWQGEHLYLVRSLRLSLRSLDGEPATAVVRYLGRGRELDPLAAELLELEVAEEVEPAGVGSLRLRLRNTGRRAWQAQALLPVAVSYRLRDIDNGNVVMRERALVPHKVPRGGVLETSIVLHWPTQPGDYLLQVELLREPAGRLGDVGRLLVAERPLRVGSDQ